MMQMPLGFARPVTNWTLPDLGRLPSWGEARRVCVDVETRDDHLTELGPGVRRGAYVAGYAFAIEDGPSYYLPVRHFDGTNLPVENVVRYMRDQAKTFKGEIVGHKLDYDLDFMAEEDVNFGEAKAFRDTGSAAALIDELQHKFSLDACAERWGLPGKNESFLREAATAHGIDPKHDLWKLDPVYVGHYAQRDVELPLQLLRRQEKDLDAQDLWSVWDLESALLPVLVKMRRRGVRIDLPHLERVGIMMRRVLVEADAQIHHLTGYRVGPDNFYNASALEPLLNSIGIQLDHDKNGNPSVSYEDLEIDHPVAKAVQHARDHAKILQFEATIRKHLVGDRIHCTFKQLKGEKDSNRARGKDKTQGAGFGRLSCIDPNLQNQPAPGKGGETLGHIWRAIYIPDDPATQMWVSADFSQQEPRGCVHYATLLGLRGAAEAAERYLRDPKTDFHTMVAEITGLPRDFVKSIGLGIMYGMGGGKLCRQLGLPTEWKTNPRTGTKYLAAGSEGQAILDQFNQRVPFVRALARACEDKAKRTGFIKTLLGRRCHFPQLDTGEYDWTYKALNRLLQGSGADQTKKAIVDLDRMGVPLQLTVHDEVNWSEDRSDIGRARARKAQRAMIDAVVLKVPSRVDLEAGDDWGHMADFAKMEAAA